jgi:hypothetical protein
VIGDASTTHDDHGMEQSTIVTRVEIALATQRDRLLTARLDEPKWTERPPAAARLAVYTAASDSISIFIEGLASAAMATTTVGGHSSPRKRVISSRTVGQSLMSVR